VFGDCPAQRRAYKLQQWSSPEDFLEQLARGSGKLLKGGDPDVKTAARMVLYDWQRGKIPFFTLPPDHLDAAPEATEQQQQQKGVEEAAVAAVAEAAGGEGELFKEAVTEEDALGEAGAQPEQARAAAKAVQEAAVSVLKQQRRGAIPIKEGFYLPEDLQQEDEQALSEGGEGLDEEEEEEQQQQGASSSGEEGEDSENEEEQREEAGGSDDGSSSGEESDGYGEAGLSFEALLQTVLVRHGSHKGFKVG
jgi:nuclear GTP-binding protein